jgi:hypothetical protein
VVIALVLLAAQAVFPGDYMTLSGEERNVYQDQLRRSDVSVREFLSGRLRLPLQVEMWLWGYLKRPWAAPWFKPSDPPLPATVPTPRPKPTPYELIPDKPVVEMSPSSWTRGPDRSVPAPFPKRPRIQRRYDGTTQSLYRVKTPDQNVRKFEQRRADRLRDWGYEGLFPREIRDRGELPLPPIRMPDGTTRSRYAVGPRTAARPWRLAPRPRAVEEGASD